MTIYLYKKTHNKTGLQYLGKTTRNPLYYKGSGKYWLKHLKKHGNDVTTEILKECQTIDEVREWGLYYSKLWNIVEEKDQVGKKVWANLREETGDGGFGLGELNPAKKKENRELKANLWKGGRNPMRQEKNKKYGNDNPMRNREVIEKYWLGKNNPSCRPEVKAKRMGKLNKNYDHTVYRWTHKTTGETVFMTQQEFRTQYGLSKSNVSDAVTGRHKSCKGWVVTKP